MKIFLLLHSYKDGDDDEQVKIIGAYSSMANAIEAQNRLMQKPGFKQYQKGFYIDKYILDKDYWVDGFIS